MDLPKGVRLVRDEWMAEVFDQELLRYKNIEEELVWMACMCAVGEEASDDGGSEEPPLKMDLHEVEFIVVGT